jgi:hypothetical protein
VLSIELLNPANLASLLLIDVLIDELIEIIFASDALNDVANEELKLFILVSNDELKFVIVVAIAPLNTFCPASDALNEVAIEELKLLMVVFVEELIEYIVE